MSNDDIEQNRLKEKYSSITGVILAGGKNSRMGRQKYLIELQGKSIIQRQLNLFQRLFSEIIIVTNHPEHFTIFSKIKVIGDQVKDIGPMGGLYSGLIKAKSPIIFLVACDMPFLDQRIINDLVAAFDSEKYSCLVPFITKGLEPLHALYTKDILPQLESCISEKRYSLQEFIRKTPHQICDLRLCKTDSFININSFNDLKRLDHLEIDVIPK